MQCQRLYVAMIEAGAEREEELIFSANDTSTESTCSPSLMQTYGAVLLSSAGVDFIMERPLTGCERYRHVSLLAFMLTLHPYCLLWLSLNHASIHSYNAHKKKRRAGFIVLALWGVRLLYSFPNQSFWYLIQTAVAVSFLSDRFASLMIHESFDYGNRPGKAIQWSSSFDHNTASVRAHPPFTEPVCSTTSGNTQVGRINAMLVYCTVLWDCNTL